jgi:hypothetical protein
MGLQSTHGRLLTVLILCQVAHRVVRLLLLRRGRRCWQQGLTLVVQYDSQPHFAVLLV